MRWKIQVWNSDIHDDWKDYVAAGEFETEEAAREELNRLYHTWTSMFKRGRVIPVGMVGKTEEYLRDKIVFIMQHRRLIADTLLQEAANISELSDKSGTAWLLGQLALAFREAAVVSYTSSATPEKRRYI